MDLKPIIDQYSKKFKDVFDFGPKTLIGLDIGQSAVKAAVLSSDKKSTTFKLEHFEVVPLSEGAIIEDEVHKEEEVVDAIKQAVKGAGAGVNKVCLGLAGQSTISRRLQLAGGSAEEIEEQVSWEAEQYIPFNPEESALSFHVVGENEGGGVDVVVASARNGVIFSYKELVEAADLRVKVVDLNALAVLNLFRFAKPDNIDSEQSMILMDIGAQNTQFLILRNGNLVFSKEMTMGGVMVTEEIQRQMGINHRDAESLKIVGDGQGNLPEEVVEIIESVNKDFLADIKKTLEFYITSTSDESFEQIFITGGGAMTPGLIEGLETALGLSVEFINPFERLDYNKNFSDEQLEVIGAVGLAAIGLAMRKIK